MAKHALDTRVAKEYGVNISLLLESFAYWTHKNFTRNHHIYDGLCWTYDTLEALCDVFPYWSKRQIEHTINNAVKVGLLVKGNYNQTKYDRTIWYALTPKSYGYYPDLLEEKYLRALWLSISQNCEMDFTYFGNRFPKIVTPIPDTIPCTDPYINISTSGEVPNLNYTQSNGQEGEKNNPDFDVQKSGIQKNNAQVAENKSEQIKSDYFDNQAKKKTNSSLSLPYNIKNIQQENIFCIPEQAILDWIANRKKKKVPVTPTAWKRINTELRKCKEQGIDPIDAFETMVGSGWQSLKVEYFQNQNKASSPQWNIDSVMRA
jgi:hypothetical protein